MAHSDDSSPPPDHRDLGNVLDLFHFQEEAPGMVFWHPRGLTLYHLLCDAARRRLRAEGYEEVRTPQVLRESIWQRSGHWTHYHDDMFAFDDGKEPVALKPVSCPGHLEIIRRRTLSHRDLPLRVAEFGLVHRREPSGALRGLFRLRQFTQDDGHIFCRPEQIDTEVERFATGLAALYRGFGFDICDVRLATRPSDRAGDDELWARAESMLGQAATNAGLAWTVQPGGGAFYGPKLEFNLQDGWGRYWQCGTIQLDLVLPGQFGVSFDSDDGSRRVPMMLHRALFGSLERFMGIVLENSAGKLAPWLAPEQARVLPVTDALHAVAHNVAAELDAAGLRVAIDASAETLSQRIFRAHSRAVPFAVILGTREAAAGTVTLREAGGRNQTLVRTEAVELLRQRCRPAL